MAKCTRGSDKWSGVFTALSKILPASLISEVLSTFGKTDKGARKLPPSLVTWLVVGMGLFRDLNVSDVLARVSEGLGLKRRRRDRPQTTSITQARDRLGWQAVRELFRRLGQRLRDTYVATTKWREFAVYALDGTTFSTADTRDNEHWFGRPGSHREGRSAFPRVRALFLVGVWSHLVVDAVFGPYRENELRLAEHILDRLQADTLILLDRAYFGFRWAALFLQRTVHFAMRAKQQGKGVARLVKKRRLGPGDWLCTMPKPERRKNDATLPDVLQVRSVFCKRKGFRPVILITDLVDHEKYPASEIAGLFRARWEVELSFRELKVHLAQRKEVLRSKKPGRVLQELYGLLIAFDCVRALMCEAANEAGVRPTRLSFLDCLHRVRWTLAGVHEPISPATILKRLLAELRECRLPARREGRTYVRAIKVKILSCFPRKRTD
jgi:hypothetical protein